MEKYTKLFKLSFISYPIMILLRPYVTARTFADLWLIFFLLTIIYQLVYLFYLRKKDDIRLGESLSKYILYTFNSISCFIIFHYLKVFIYGYIPTDFVGNPIGPHIRGFEAISKDGWNNLVFFPWLIINIILLIIHYSKKKNIK